MIAPWPRAIMPGSTARVRRTSARTFRQISASSWSGSSLAKGPDVPKPALLTSNARASSPAARSSTARNAMDWVKSATTTSTAIPSLCRKRSARASRRSRLRATMMRSYCCRARAVAKTAPRPVEAPVTSARRRLTSRTVAVCAMRVPPQAFQRTLPSASYLECGVCPNPLAGARAQGDRAHLHPLSLADTLHKIRYNPPVSLVWPGLVSVVSPEGAQYAPQRLWRC